MVGRGWSGDGSVDRREAGAIGVRAAAAAQRTIRAGAERYQRVRDLPKLARLDPAELSTETIERAEKIVSCLMRALRAERSRARSGHWTYDLNRHIALRQAYLAERERLERIKTERAPALQRGREPGS
jgi:hypothetical protein